ncbi:MAG: response regulator [Deltaproteobacteria bacterium]|nr:response regulator [Deltaproteobacteria bacterium]MCL5276529.1 response regulator [Deltaproteobacteria bacterium]
MIKILLVDDMRNFLDLEVSFLRRAESKVITAKDGAEALKLAKIEKPDIVLLDLEMPKMNGIECCRIIKSDPSLKKIPVVMVTSTDRRGEALKAGCDDFVRKPINESAFLEEVKKFVEIKVRKEDRYDISIEVKYEYKDRTVSVYSKDLSYSGLSIITNDIIPLNTILNMALSLPLQSNSGKSESHKYKAKVMRTFKEETDGHTINGIGLEFVDATSRSLAALKTFIDNKVK